MFFRLDSWESNRTTRRSSAARPSPGSWAAGTSGSTPLRCVSRSGVRKAALLGCRRPDPRLRPQPRGRPLSEPARRPGRGESNAIGTTYLRAQLLAEPERSESLGAAAPSTRRWALRVAHEGAEQRRPKRRTTRRGGGRHPAGGSGDSQDRRSREPPVASAPRLYVDSLNSTGSTSSPSSSERAGPTACRRRFSAVRADRAPRSLSDCSQSTSRCSGAASSTDAGSPLALVIRAPAGHVRPRPPHRGLIEVPDAPLKALRASMALPPAA